LFLFFLYPLLLYEFIKRHSSVSAPSYARRDSVETAMCLFYAKRRIDRYFDYRISITTESIKFKMFNGLDLIYIRKVFALFMYVSENIAM